MHKKRERDLGVEEREKERALFVLYPYATLLSSKTTGATGISARYL